MSKKLYRIPEGKKISGVCTGLSEYFGIDVSLVRIAWVILALFTFGIGTVIFYAACVFCIPEMPSYVDADFKEM